LGELLEEVGKLSTVELYNQLDVYALLQFIGLRKTSYGTLQGIGVYLDPRRRGMVLGSLEVASCKLSG
jgi:hypothetical protein